MAAKTRAIPFVEDYLPAMMAKAGSMISSEFHTVARQEGFSVSEWRVLACLADGEDISMGDLAEAALTKQPTLTRQLDRMEANGYVTRAPYSGDRRVTLVRITAKGRKVARRLIALSHEHEQRMLAPLGQERAQALKNMLRDLIDSHSSTADAEEDKKLDA